MLRQLIFLLTTVSVYQCGGAATLELLHNANLESAIDASNWICSSCTAVAVKESFSGSQALLATKRTRKWSGPTQVLPVDKVKPGQAYTFSSRIKIRKSKINVSPQNFYVNLIHTTTAGKVKYQKIVNWQRVVLEDKWLELGADIVVADYGTPLRALTLQIAGPDPNVAFLLDDCSLTPLPLNKTWKNEALARIEALRKGNLTISLQTDKPLKKVQIQMKQLTHEFGFGSAVSGELLVNNASYRNWYLNNFEWAVLENDMKWKQTEWSRGKLTFDKPDQAMKILTSNGKKVRGHAVFWANGDRNPKWVTTITNRTEFKQICTKRAHDIVDRYKGRIAHWDVNNEMTATQFYVEKYGSESIRPYMFNLVKKLDPSATLFLNDFNIINNGMRLQMYVNEAQQFLKSGVPIEAIGAQSHFYERPEGPVILKRLDKLAAAGLPIWITELDYAVKHNQERANALEDALTAFFSHPSVNGVLFWGYSDIRHNRGSEASLVNGADMTPNAAGKMWQRLFHKKWRTNITRTLGYVKLGQETTTTTRVFYGEYQITVISDGVTVHTEKVTIGKSQGQSRVNIVLSQNPFG